MNRVIYFLEVALILLGCEKGELPIEPHRPGNVKINQVVMMSDYRNQLFYDLGTNNIVRQNIKTEWDLGFESSEEGWHIILNSALGGSVAHIENTNFDQITSSENLVWNWDAHSGNLDSTAFGDYRNTSKVYVLNRGYDHLGTYLGYRKIKITEVTSGKYKFRIANLDNTDDISITLDKDTSTNFTAFSFNTNSSFSFEPQKKDWDLLFTQYIHIFKEPVLTPYLVTGVLLNRIGVMIAIDTINDFTAITKDNIQAYEFKSGLNSIGYDWKRYDHETGIYLTLSDKTYIIKDHERKYYKLHFIDFYDKFGTKGAPKFEVQEL